MRVQLTRRPADREHGAVAIMVAVMLVVIFGLAAFAVDFGMAYTSKRNLQKGADAAALAAAGEIIRLTATTESCAAVASRYDNDASFRAAVQSVADSYADENRADAVREDMDVRCSADNQRVEVYYRSGGDTPRLFGAIFGTGAYHASRSAVSDLFVPSSGQGLRPYFVCVVDLGQLQAVQSSVPGWVKIRYPAQNAGLCGDYAGNWYTSDCPLDGNNGTLDENTLNGCLTEVSIVSASNPAAGVTQSDVVTACTDFAGDDPASCLQANPGNIASNVVVTAWDHLLTLESIAIPVFDKGWKTWADSGSPDCSTNGQGNQGCYPVKALAGVQVCAYKWGPKDRASAAASDPDSPCYGAATDLAATTGNDNYLWLHLKNVQLTGSSKPAGCALGDTNCDAGARGTRLTE